MFTVGTLSNLFQVILYLLIYFTHPFPGPIYESHGHSAYCKIIEIAFGVYSPT